MCSHLNLMLFFRGKLGEIELCYFKVVVLPKALSISEFPVVIAVPCKVNYTALLPETVIFVTDLEN